MGMEQPSPARICPRSPRGWQGGGTGAGRAVPAPRFARAPRGCPGPGHRRCQRGENPAEGKHHAPQDKQLSRGMSEQTGSGKARIPSLGKPGGITAPGPCPPAVPPLEIRDLDQNCPSAAPAGTGMVFHPPGSPCREVQLRLQLYKQRVP